MIALVAIVIGSCRDSPTPFDSVDLEPLGDTTAVRVTYSLGNDRSSAWNEAGDTIYYIAEGIYAGIPASPGVMVSMPSAGGTALPILEGKQVGASSAQWLTAPGVSADGSRSAYIELTNVAELTTSCRNYCTVFQDTAYSIPRLVSGILHVTKLAPDASVDDARLDIAFEGRRFDESHRPYNLLGTWIWAAYPYQRRFSRESAHVFRPSWSPDGSRLVFSDGLRLYLWNVGEATARPIAGTVDGVWPAWSPDGQTIAYTRLLRSDSVVTECLCVNERGSINEVQRRIIFEYDEGTEGALVLIRPDGTGLRVIGAGDAPAWTRDNKLVFRRGGYLWLTNGDGSSARRIAGTADAWEPAVSPDGKKVSFTRKTGPGNWDIWVAPLRFD